jgi:HK97 family phage major capsid protein
MDTNSARERASDFARAGRADLVRDLHRDALNAAERILERARIAGRDLTSAESREFDTHRDDARVIGELIGRADEVRMGIALRHPHLGDTTDNTDSPTWRAMRQGHPVRLTLPLGKGIAHRVVGGQLVERRDLTTSISTVPTRVFDELLMAVVLRSGVLAAGPRTITTDGRGGTIRVPRLTTYGTASIVSEGGAFAESDPTINSTVELTTYKIGNLLQVSSELLSDTDFDLEQFLGRALGTQVGNTVGSALAVGNGTSAPEGIMTNATTGVTGTATGGTATIGELQSLYASVPAQYRAGASFVLNPSAYRDLVAQNDTTGRSLVLPDLTSSQPLQLFGLPVFLDTNIAAFGSGAKSIWCGNMAEYLMVRYAGDLEIVSSPDFDFDNDLITYRSKLRLDSAVVNSDAARVFVGKA